MGLTGYSGDVVAVFFKGPVPLLWQGYLLSDSLENVEAFGRLLKKELP